MARGIHGVLVSVPDEGDVDVDVPSRARVIVVAYGLRCVIKCGTPMITLLCTM